MKKGFTLVEIMISLAIITGIVVGTVYTYGNLARLSSVEKEEAETNTDIAITCTLLQKDIAMAGFATPNVTRFASENGINRPDRLFLADGWEIMRDFSDNREDDGIITSQLYGSLTDASRGGRGYSATLTVPAQTGTIVIEVGTLNVDPDAPLPPDDDFRDNGSFIIANGGNNPPEGVRIRTLAGNVIGLERGLQRDYNAGSLVVPASCYHIAQFENRNWLCRNDARVIRNVESLEVEYGYDDLRDRILTNNEWIASLPANYDPNLLRAIRISFGIRVGGNKIATYTVSSELRN